MVAPLTTMHGCMRSVLLFSEIIRSVKFAVFDVVPKLLSSSLILVGQELYMHHSELIFGFYE